MALTIGALLTFIFGAYAYGHLTLLWLRGRPRFTHADGHPTFRESVEHVGLAMFAACTVWFVLNAIIEFRFLLGEARENDWLDLATLELVFVFPGLILHTYLREASAGHPHVSPNRRWRYVLWALYGGGLAAALYFPAAIFRLVPSPDPIGAFIGLSIGSLFTASSISCLILMQSRPRRAATPEQRRLRIAMKTLFLVLIGLFLVLNLTRTRTPLIQMLEVGARTTPLYFLLVSVYFESRIEFYDLVIKRGVLLMMSLLLTGAVFALTLGWIDSFPEGPARPWLFAVLLLPVAMFMPWLHSRAERMLDRIWFGREFTTVDAVKHVLAAMQQATDEASLVRATEATLSDIFHRRVAILRDGDPIPDTGFIAAEIRTPAAAESVRLAMVSEPAGRAMLSEDLALLRSLGGVFGYMLENVRLQRRRQEQDQLAHQLRLQSSRSELKALRAQINPHFLFNALNAIASLIHTDPARADLAVEQLAEVFRYTLRRSDQEWAPLDQELALARAYLDVEQARFGKRLQFAIQADPRLARAHVPSMLLQTLVENAVKHGIARLRTPGRIDISTRLDAGRVALEVRDTGPGPDVAPTTFPPGEGFGLRSIRDRLRGHFGAAASLSLVRDGDVTIVRVEVPLIEDLAPAAGGR